MARYIIPILATVLLSACAVAPHEVGSQRIERPRIMLGPGELIHVNARNIRMLYCENGEQLQCRTVEGGRLATSQCLCPQF